MIPSYFFVQVLSKAIVVTTTGQLINPSKCSILFSGNCPSTISQEVMGILEITLEIFDPKYLGWAVPTGRMHK